MAWRRFTYSNDFGSHQVVDNCGLCRTRTFRTEAAARRRAEKLSAEDDAMVQAALHIPANVATINFRD